MKKKNLTCVYQKSKIKELRLGGKQVGAQYMSSATCDSVEKLIVA